MQRVTRGTSSDWIAPDDVADLRQRMRDCAEPTYRDDQTATRRPGQFAELRDACRRARRVAEQDPEQATELVPALFTVLDAGDQEPQPSTAATLFGAAANHKAVRRNTLHALHAVYGWHRPVEYPDITPSPARALRVLGQCLGPATNTTYRGLAIVVLGDMVVEFPNVATRTLPVGDVISQSASALLEPQDESDPRSDAIRTAATRVLAVLGRHVPGAIPSTETVRDAQRRLLKNETIEQTAWGLWLHEKHQSFPKSDIAHDNDRLTDLLVDALLSDSPESAVEAALVAGRIASADLGCAPNPLGSRAREVMTTVTSRTGTDAATAAIVALELDATDLLDLDLTVVQQAVTEWAQEAPALEIATQQNRLLTVALAGHLSEAHLDSAVRGLIEAMPARHGEPLKQLSRAIASFGHAGLVIPALNELSVDAVLTRVQESTPADASPSLVRAVGTLAIAGVIDDVMQAVDMLLLPAVTCSPTGNEACTVLGELVSEGLVTDISVKQIDSIMTLIRAEDDNRDAAIRLLGDLADAGLLERQSSSVAVPLAALLDALEHDSQSQSQSTRVETFETLGTLLKTGTIPPGPDRERTMSCLQESLRTGVSNSDSLVAGCAAAALLKGVESGNTPEQATPPISELAMLVREDVDAGRTDAARAIAALFRTGSIDAEQVTAELGAESDTHQQSLRGALTPPASDATRVILELLQEISPSVSNQFPHADTTCRWLLTSHGVPPATRVVAIDLLRTVETPSQHW